MPKKTISPEQLGFDFVEFRKPTDLSGLDAETEDKPDDKHPRVQYIIRAGIQHTEYPDRPCPCTETWVGEHSGLTHCVVCYPPLTTKNEWLERYTLGAIPLIGNELELTRVFFEHIGAMNELERSQSGSTFPKIDTIGEAGIENAPRPVDDIEAPVASGNVEASHPVGESVDSRSDFDKFVDELESDRATYNEREVAMVRAVSGRSIPRKEGTR